ncbi:uncharacterized protein KY384_001421 [Bacidia gigantensis]|uniref:uncharacterized protein n=1 Tax=Bacidia gigantensis TaxID=2732470 RepID=UPI001D0526A5|nr:uncharacterized protein KY384_001421 [Bacidia gigantensis]KAG8533680.1 hypothetical protein KY384_001421 [Bacidia gigantensis]
MASQNKTPFGQSSGTSGASLFGQTSTTSQPSAGGIFGSATNSSGSGGAFGSTNTTSTGGSGLFGSTPTTSGGGPGLFGSTPTSGAPGTGLFGAATGSKNSFGGGGGSVLDAAAKTSFTGFSSDNLSNRNATGTSNTTPAVSTQTTAAGATTTSSAPPFSWTTPSKTSEPSNDQNQTPKPTFGGIGSSLSNQATTNVATTTPTSKPTTSIFGNSTTPAGLPPTANVGFGSSAPNLFSPQNQNKPTLFGNVSKPANNAGINSTTAAPSPFDTSNQQRPQQNNDLFSGAKKPQETSSNQKATLVPLGGQSQLSPAQTNAPSIGGTSAAPGFSFLKPSVPVSSAASVSSSGLTSSAPAFFPPISTSSTTASSAPSSNPFPAAKPQDTTGSTPGPFTSNATTAGNAFPSLGKPSSLASAPPLGSSQPLVQTASKSATSDALPSTNLSASTSGPLPPAQSRLKNKSMDEIINKWATDLSKYQKEFQTQAEKVARWDRMLVENSEKIQKLYGQTLEAERATTEVERQLSAVENDQTELESWLNHYEKEVDLMIKQQGEGEATTGPDAERQRTYQLAGRLSERLDEMNKDLTSMIDEINDASSSLSRTGKKDDPVRLPSRPNSRIWAPYYATLTYTAL